VPTTDTGTQVYLTGEDLYLILGRLTGPIWGEDDDGGDSEGEKPYILADKLRKALDRIDDVRKQSGKESIRMVLSDRGNGQ